MEIAIGGGGGTGENPYTCLPHMAAQGGERARSPKRQPIMHDMCHMG